MNGGVMSCTAGELAWGAFDHGFEEYGAEILSRYAKIAAAHHHFVPGILRGEKSVTPARHFAQVDLRSVANADFGPGTGDVLGWMDEPGNELPSMPSGRQMFREIPFDVIEPSSNGLRACLAISSLPKFKRNATVTIDATARSFYLLHTKGGDDLVGKLTVRYADGEAHGEYIRAGININHWWAPVDSEFNERYGPTGPERMQVAWRGANQKFGNLGVYVVGFEHPHPEKTIAALDFECLDTGAKWMVLGITLCDAPMFLPPWNDVSFGMPNNWGAAALTAAILEGLAGVQDKGAAFSKARIALRWSAIGTNKAKVSVRYPASQGYVHYQYSYDQARGQTTVEFTGSAQEYDLELLLPENAVIRRATLDGSETAVQTRTVESSHYATIRATKPGAHRLVLESA